MRVPGVIFADEALIRAMDDKVAEQVANVATLPGIVQAAYAMPDAHWGYGFPIGGVAAFDPDDGGVVSAGGVGFDISCGVRTLLTGLTRADVLPVRRRLADALAAGIPAGVGSTGAMRLAAPAMDAMLARRRSLGRGAAASASPPTSSASRRTGWSPGADPAAFRPRPSDGSATRWGRSAPATTTSRSRSSPRSSMPDIADAFGLRRRRCGDQHPLRLARPRATRSAPSYLRRDGGRAPRPRASRLPDRELACAPIRSPVGQRYLGAMRAAINCALANRQILAPPRARGLRQRASGGPAARCSSTSRTTPARLERHVVDGERAQPVRPPQGRDARVRPRARGACRRRCARPASRC